MLTHLDVRETDTKLKAAGIDFANVPFTLWKGTADNGQPISVWVPDWVPESFYDVAMRRAPETGPAQDMHMYRRPRRLRKLRAGKRKGVK